MTLRTQNHEVMRRGSRYHIMLVMTFVFFVFLGFFLLLLIVLNVIAHVITIAIGNSIAIVLVVVIAIAPYLIVSVVSIALVIVIATDVVFAVVIVNVAAITTATDMVVMTILEKFGPTNLRVCIYHGFWYRHDSPNTRYLDRLGCTWRLPLPE